MRCVVLDLEFTQLVPEESLESSSIQIACAATLLSDTGNAPILWTPHEDVPALDMDRLVSLIGYLEAMVQRGYLLVTWGGMSSDFRMLQKECPILKSTIQKLALDSIDVPFVSACVQGMMMSLSSAAEGLNIQDTKAFKSSIKVPDLWTSGKRSEVHDHVCLDVRLTMEVFQNCAETGILKWKTMRGFIRVFRFEFVTVRNCLTMPRPNVPFEISSKMDPKVQAQWLYF